MIMMTVIMMAHLFVIYIYHNRDVEKSNRMMTLIIDVTISTVSIVTMIN